MGFLEEIFPEGIEVALARRSVERFTRSWGEQPREERRRRLKYVLEMSVELAEIKKATKFGTIWAEICIEAVIEGDLVALNDFGVKGLSREDFIKNVGSEEYGVAYAKLYARFRELCEDAYLTAMPKERV